MMKPPSLVAALTGLVAFIDDDPERFNSPHLNCRDCNEFTPITKPEWCPFHAAKRALADAELLRGNPRFSPEHLARRLMEKVFKERAGAKVEAHLSREELAGLFQVAIELALDLKASATDTATHVCDYRCGENGHHAWPSPSKEPQ